MVKRHTDSGVSIGIRNTMQSLQNGSPLTDKQKPSEFTIKVANTLEERESVFRLAYQVYLKKGFIKENENEWLVNTYDAESETLVLIVQDKNKKTVGSVSLAFDGASKLPAEKIYCEEINHLKLSKEKLVEVSRLIIDPEFRNFKEILVLLINYLMIYSYHVKKCTSLIIEVNPHHKNYYKSLLHFEELGGEKPCPSVENAPAVLLQLPLIHYQSEIQRISNLKDNHKKERSLYASFIKPEQENLVAHYLQKQFRPMRAEEKVYFGFIESGFTRALCVK